MKQTPHLLAASLATTMMIVTAVGFDLYARSLEARYVNALANTDLSQIQIGIALQQASLAKADLLPMYGGSEVTAEDSPYIAYRFFETYPTSFTVFDVAQVGASLLTIAQDLAALGPDLRGKKVVISFTPSTFDTYDLNELVYDGNFSRLHAYGLVFSPSLSMDLKQMAAKRMLEFPQTINDDPLLKFGLVNLAGKSVINQCLYYLGWPIGILQTALIRIQDHQAVVSFILTHPELHPDVSHHPAAIDWTAADSTAWAEQLVHTLNNPDGVDNHAWSDYQSQQIIPALPGSQDKKFIQTIDSSKEWDDLEIVLQILKELGAKPLIMSRPMNVQLWEEFGVTRQAQNTYYARLHAVIGPYQFSSIDFRQYDGDKYFSMDGASHTSREGWVHVDQALDLFYHGLMH